MVHTIVQIAGKEAVSCLHGYKTHVFTARSETSQDVMAQLQQNAAAHAAQVIQAVCYVRVKPL